MPIMDGIEAVKKIRAKHGNAKIIVISAIDQKKMILQALQSGAMNYLLKPYTKEKLIAVVYDVLNK
jgi:YesN/AraC family two-component response regulator